MSAPPSLVGLGDRAFFRVNSRLEPEQLQAGDLSLSLNGRMERGSWQPRRGISCTSGALQETGTPLKIPFFLVDAPGGLPIDSASRTGTTVTLEIAGHPFTPGDVAWLKVEGLTGSEDPNGLHLIEVQDVLNLTYELVGTVGSETYAGSGTVINELDDAAAAEIFGSCLFSDPSSESVESIIIAASGEAYAVATADGTVTAIPYPTGGTLTGTVDLLQAHDRVLLFRDGARTWELLSGATDFTEVPGGDYTQPQVFEVTGVAAVVANGLCTLTVVGNATVDTGDTGILYGSDDPHFEPFIGKRYKVTLADATTIKFYIPVEDLATIGSNVLSFGKPVSVGGGLQYMPAPPWAVHHNRRLICPYRYTQASVTPVVYTDRDVRDELVISDILDPHAYDAIENQFRVTGGTADFLVGVQPFAEDKALVFMRNSVHVLTGLLGSLEDCTVAELTRETGLLARKSVAQCGGNILFLADNGVYGVQYRDDFTLAGIELPLSDAIQDVIDRINPDLAGDAVGIYFSNRYWLAVPLDSAVGAGDATGNNSILVFNFLNKGWESVDSASDGRWNVLNFHISRAGERNDLYAVNSLGGVHKMDAVDRDSDELAVEPGGSPALFPVLWEFRTRGYGGESPERKRFTQFQVLLESAAQNSDGDFEFSTEDPDSVQTLGSIASSLAGSLPAGEGASVPVRIGGHRGHHGALSMRAGHGRPKLKSVKVDATETNRQTVNQR